MRVELTSLRDLFIRELRSAPSLDENGYICTKDEAIKALDRALTKDLQEDVK